MTSFVAIIAFLLGIAGLFFASQATVGVALIGFACLLGILARISQAEVQHRAMQAAAASVKADTPPPRPVAAVKTDVPRPVPTVPPPGARSSVEREKS